MTAFPDHPFMDFVFQTNMNHSSGTEASVFETMMNGYPVRSAHDGPLDHHYTENTIFASQAVKEMECMHLKREEEPHRKCGTVDIHSDLEKPMEKKKRSSNVPRKEAQDGKAKKAKVTNITKEAKEKSNRKENEDPTKDYIHVRARRGQATDSHSLAERVRREKISERMRMLQELVPGCDKVTGKALMLDEIINYVQSLKNQVEFLSMKLASLDPIVYSFNMDLEEYNIKLENQSAPLPELQDWNFSPPTVNFDRFSLSADTTQITNNLSTLNSLDCPLLLHHMNQTAAPQENSGLVSSENLNQRLTNEGLFKKMGLLH